MAGPAAEPTSAEAPERELPAAASSCTAVVGIAVPVGALLAEPRLLEVVASLWTGREGTERVCACAGAGAGAGAGALAFWAFT